MILCLDFETSSLNERRGSILQIGACWLHSGETFFRECFPENCNWPDGGLLIEDEALEKNGIARDKIYSREGAIPEGAAIMELVGWARGPMADFGKIQIAAWNAHFEHRWLRAALNRVAMPDKYRPFAHRLLDAHSILAADEIRRKRPSAPQVPWWSLLGGEVANSDQASEIVGLPVEEKPHNALNGARQVRAMLRRLLGDVEAQP